MDKIVIEGGFSLNGSIRISGAKNAALPLMAASLLTAGKTKLSNVPDLRDTRTILKLLESLGVGWEKTSDGSLILDAGNITNVMASYDLVKTMRASVLVLGPLVARMGEARVSLPGGCAIGARPIDFHLQALEKMGATITLQEGYVEAKVKGRLQGATIYFDIPTVTGTENVLMAAVLAKGQTIIKNAAREPEVGNLIDLLRRMGADIEGRDSDKIIVNGVSTLKPAQIDIIPDRIETGTYLIAVGVTGGDVTLENCNPAHLPSLIEKLKAAGLQIDEDDATMRVQRRRALRSVDVKTMPYPGFPTDLQAQMMALMAFSNGLSVINETIFENRYMHVAELRRMGADVKTDGRSAIVKGTGGLTGARVMATDLRASASLVVAGLGAHGTTEISRIYHLERGYADLVSKMAQLGAHIEQTKE